MAIDRMPNHDSQGRKDEGTLAERVDKAKDMIGDMCAKGRPPHMTVPAGDRLHDYRCGDEDIYIVDLLDDLITSIMLDSVRTEAKSGVDMEVAATLLAPDPFDERSPGKFFLSLSDCNRLARMPAGTKLYVDERYLKQGGG